MARGVGEAREESLDSKRGRDRFGSLLNGVANDGMESEAVRHRLLHEMPAFERGNRIVDVSGWNGRELRERDAIDVVTFGIGQHGEHPPALRW